MSLHKLSLQKLKKKCQEKLYNSIENTLELDNAQTYLPAFTQTLKFDNSYSKKMFIFNSKFVLLGVGKDEANHKKVNTDDDNKNRLSFSINESLQGNIMGNIVNHKLYQKSKCEDDYQRFIAEIPMFIKSNPLLDVISYMEGKYDFHSSIPSVFSMLTNKKINDIHNNAYLEVICAYFLNLLQEKKKCTLFPHFYGSFNGLARNYVHDISEDFPHIRNSSWFEEKNDKLQYEVIRNNNLQDYQSLSFKNIEKIDYHMERDLQYKKDKELDINGLATDSEQENKKLSLEGDFWEGKQELEVVDWSLLQNKAEDSESNLEFELEKLDMDSIEEFSGEKNSVSENMSEESSEADWSSLSSDGSCIFSETFLKIKNFPVQILAMERLDMTLTELVKTSLSLGEWKSLLFELCFGLAVAQKNFDFIHNDLHSDNIMFKGCKLEYKYYKYQNTLFRVPTWGRETKVIDFARGILKVGKKLYFSDVFKNEGDAGGQYQYLNSQKRKKFNFHFDLARLATTIREFTENKKDLKEVDKLLVSWCLNKNGESFLEMDDNFSLYVHIASTANNSLPKEQLENSIFQDFVITPENIPENQEVFYFSEEKY